MYYVDSYAKEVVREKCKFAAPERYYEYRRGTLEGKIIETYIVSHHPLVVVDFSHLTSDHPSFDPVLLETDRINFFKKHNISRPILYAYTVPPSWYDEEISKIFKFTNIKEEDFKYEI